MANPQKENGYVPIANELVDAFCRLRLSPNEWQVLWCILRYSYGWNKKAAKLTYSKITELTDIASKNIARILKKLKGRGIISGNKETLSLQKDYDKWSCYSLNRGSLNRGSLNREYPTLCLESNLASKQRVATHLKPLTDKGLREPKDIYKDIYKDISLTKPNKYVDNYIKDERDIFLKDIKKHFPKLTTIPKTLFHKADYLLYKIDKGEVLPDRIKNLLAYLKALEINETYPHYDERQRIKKRIEEGRMIMKKKEDEELKIHLDPINREKNKEKIKQIIKNLEEA